MNSDQLPLSDRTPTEREGGPRDRGLALQPQQSALYRALSTVGEGGAGKQLAACYLGARAALADLGNPDRLAQAAHSLREMMDLMTYAVDVRVEALREKLTNKGAKLYATRLSFSKKIVSAAALTAPREHRPASETGPRTW